LCLLVEGEGGLRARIGSEVHGWCGVLWSGCGCRRVRPFRETSSSALHWGVGAEWRRARGCRAVRRGRILGVRGGGSGWVLVGRVQKGRERERRVRRVRRRSESLRATPPGPFGTRVQGAELPVRVRVPVCLRRPCVQGRTHGIDRPLSLSRERAGGGGLDTGQRGREVTFSLHPSFPPSPSPSLPPCFPLSLARAGAQAVRAGGR
jgi:hypothetical protein